MRRHKFLRSRRLKVKLLKLIFEEEPQSFLRLILEEAEELEADTITFKFGKYEGTHMYKRRK